MGMQEVYIKNQFFLQIINAAITPGTHPAIVSRTTKRIEPQPLSNTASGGKRIHKMTLPKLMALIVFRFYKKYGLSIGKALMLLMKYAPAYSFLSAFY